MIKIKTIKFLSLLLFFSYGCQTDNDSIEVDKGVQEFPLGDVTLLDSEFKEARDRAAEGLLEYYEPARLLARLRPLADLKPQAPKYMGWETWATGHSLGHYLSGLSMAYAETGKKEFKNRVEYIVTDLALIQEKSGSGFISKPEDKEKFENEIAKGKIDSKGFMLNGMNVPLYLMHKILSGLRDAHRWTGSQQALEVEQEFADWIYTQIMHLDEEKFQKILECEHGGIAESFADLYHDTGKKKYLELSKRFWDEGLMPPIFQGKDNLAGQHANTQIPKYIGLARIFEVDGSTREKTTAVNFWNLVADHHSYVTGGNSYHEHFSPPDELNDYLDQIVTESCNSYNMLKLSKHLFQWSPNAKVADFVERTILNHSLASQNPVNAHVMYNLPLGMPAKRNFEEPLSFTCCVGSGMEHHFLYSRLIYAHNDSQLYLNQFIPSKVDWKEKGVSIVQTTNFPFNGESELKIKAKKPVEFQLLIRRPHWLEKEMTATLNEKELKLNLLKNGYYGISRKWDDGDILKLVFPFELHLETMPDNEDRVAIFNGPLLLGGDLGDFNTMDSEDGDFVPVLSAKNKPISDWIKPVNTDRSVFELNGVGEPRDVKLRPFFQLYNRYHTAYWDRFTPKEWKKNKNRYLAQIEGFKNLEERTVDYFQPGEMQPERDHAFEGENLKVVEYEGIKGRKAEDGWFTFEMKVLPDHPMALTEKYWGNISGDDKAVFDIYVENEKIATRIIHWHGSFFEVTEQIPEHLTKGKEKVKISFRTSPGFQAGPLCGIRMIRIDEVKVHK